MLEDQVLVDRKAFFLIEILLEERFSRTGVGICNMQEPNKAVHVRIYMYKMHSLEAVPADHKSMFTRLRSKNLFNQWDTRCHLYRGND